MQRCWAGDRRDEDGRDRAQVGNSGALFAAFITSWSWNQHGEHGPLRLVDGDGGVGRSGKGGGVGGGRSPHQTCHHYLPFQTRINSVIIIWVFRDTLEGTPVICVFPDTHELVFITCVFPDTHELCHLYRCLPRHARSVSSLSVSSQTHMKGAPS